MEKQARQKHLMILGTRGIPARHGGFETFAEHLARHLAGHGWRVTVYCQGPKGSEFHESQWEGIRLVHIPAGGDSPLATIWFDLRSTLHAAAQPGLILTLGYNTAIFLSWYKLRGKRNLINMDGLEWRRSKWSLPAKIWLYCNERIAIWLADHLIADNPGIGAHLSEITQSQRISMIPYGAPSITHAETELLRPFGLEPNRYALVVARGEPENSILEIIQAFTRKQRHLKLVVLGKYTPETSDYHRQVVDAGNDEVVLPGAIYDASTVGALRFFARLYVHGHQVGGTNPSLVEALGAGNPVLAHDNRFNRWVAGDAAFYFGDAESCAERFDALLTDEARLANLRSLSRQRHGELFQWPSVLEQYEALLSHWHE